MWHRVLRALSPAHTTLAPDDRQEARIADEVPAEQPLRLLHEAEEPLQSAPLHPLGSPPDESVVHVERRPHGEEQREGYVLGLEATDHAVDDVALLGEPECHEDVARAGGEDSGGARLGERVDPCGVIEGEAGSEHRGDGTVLGLDPGRDLVGGRDDEDDMSPATRRGKSIATRELPGEAGPQRLAEEAARPDDRLAVGEDVGGPPNKGGRDRIGVPIEVDELVDVGSDHQRQPVAAFAAVRDVGGQFVGNGFEVREIDEVESEQPSSGER